MARQKVTRERIQELSKAGLTPREIAKATDLSTQRVYKLLRELRDAGSEPTEDEAAS